jgi:hypothetical protein
MALTPTNYIYDNVLTKIESFLRTEYDSSLPIFIEEEYKKNRNSHIRLFVNGITNVDSKEKSVVNRVDVSVNLYLNIKGDDVQVKKKLSDMTNRLEQVLFENNRNADNLYYNGKVDLVEMDIKEDEEVFVDNLRVSRINYSVEIPLYYNTYGFLLLSNGDNFLTSSSDKFLVLN